jgi:glycosyltransferase involved in cell wall biosynthesis
VLAQTDADFELVICDDGSTDGSWQILTSYAQHEKVRLLRNEPNAGLFPTLNRLVRESRGPIVRLWAQDDVMKPGCLAREVQFWNQHPDLGFVYIRCDLIDNQGVCFQPASVDWVPEVTSPWLLGQLFCYHGCLPGNISTVTIRRSVLDQTGLFDETLAVAADYDMWERIGRTYAMGCIQDPLVQIRFHPEQYSRAGPSAAKFVRECVPITERIAHRYPSRVRSRLRDYLRRVTYVSYTHQLFQAVIQRRWRDAKTISQALSQVGPILRLVVHWVATLNTRWFRPLQVLFARRSGNHRTEAAEIRRQVSNAFPVQEITVD